MTRPREPAPEPLHRHARREGGAARRQARDAARRRAHPRLHAGRHAGHREGAHAPRPDRLRHAHPPREHLPPDASPRLGAHPRAGRAPPLHGVERSHPDRQRRLPGAEFSGSREAPRRRGGVPLASRRHARVSHAGALDGGAGGFGLRHRRDARPRGDAAARSPGAAGGGRADPPVDRALAPPRARPRDSLWNEAASLWNRTGKCVPGTAGKVRARADGDGFSRLRHRRRQRR